jgi:hypothetical protein
MSDVPMRPGSWGDPLFLIAMVALMIFFACYIGARVSWMRDRAWDREQSKARHEQWREATCADWRAKFSPELLANNEYYQRLCVRKEI